MNVATSPFCFTPSFLAKIFRPPHSHFHQFWENRTHPHFPCIKGGRGGGGGGGGEGGLGTIRTMLNQNLIQKKLMLKPVWKYLPVKSCIMQKPVNRFTWFALDWFLVFTERYLQILFVTTKFSKVCHALLLDKSIAKTL